MLSEQGSRPKAMSNHSDHSRSRRLVAGSAAAIASLASGQFVSSLDSNGPTLIDAVGSGFIDRYAATLKDIAVTIFGTHNKTALIIGVWIVAVGIGAVSALTRPAVTRTVWAAAGAIGFAAHSSRPESSTVIGLVSAATAVAIGVAVLTAFDRYSPAPPEVAVPGTGSGNRRQFLTLASGTLAGSAALVVVGRALHQRAPSLARVLNLPLPTESVAVPLDTGISVAGVSEYVTPIDDFYRIDTALRVPRIDPGTWALRVDGMVEQPLTITYGDLLNEDSISIPVTIACVSNQIGGDLVGTAVWQGVPLDRLLERCGVDPAASQIVSHSTDGFTAGMPTAVALDGRTSLVAYAMNGQPLPERHGFPARLIVSGLYGYVSATKWLNRIELTTMEATDGYWIPRGWAKEAPVKIASRIDVPGRGDITSGTTPIAGVAWAPSTGIAAVEVSINESAWLTCELGRVSSDDTWVQWRYLWAATPGTHTIAVRAIGSDGEVQTDQVAAVAPDGATGHHRRRVNVR